MTQLRLAYQDHQNRKERSKFINALLSKNAGELRDLEFADKLEIKHEIPREPDLVPLDQATDEQFDKVISEEIA